MKTLLLAGSLVACLGSGYVLADDGAAPASNAPVIFGDWHVDAPGARHRLTPADLPSPLGTKFVVNVPEIVAKPDGAWPKVPRGFDVTQFATGLENPRMIRVAPDGEVFVAESKPGRIRVLPAPGSADTGSGAVFASALNMPFGIAFYPPGPDPHYVYIGDRDAILRFPYRRGDLVARGPAETIIRNLPTEGHWTRDIAFSPDGQRMFVSLGSLSNDAETMPRRTVDEIRVFEQGKPPGAAWGMEEGRAVVLAADPGGENVSLFATGLRNCVGMGVRPRSTDLWCTNNERDQFGDNLVPDFITRIRADSFYGWPWYYIGAHEDPLHQGERPDLADQVLTPDVLLQPHSAPLSFTFYEGTQFPPEYRGDVFLALHGSYSRSQRTGYKVVRVLFRDGAPTGEYEDFMTGFVASDAAVWGRPVGVAVARDGSLLVSEDANGTIWRITYQAANVE